MKVWSVVHGSPSERELHFELDVPAASAHTAFLVANKYSVKIGWLNEPAVVEFTPKSSGEIGFVCGMNMLRGTVVVQ